MPEELEKPLVWIVDSERSPLGECLPVFDACCSAFRYFEAGEPFPDDGVDPDAIVFSAEIAGGPGGGAFADLRSRTAGIPLLAASRVRSLAQAVAFFRAGADDYLSLPLDPDELSERLDAAFGVAAYPPPTVFVEVERIGSARSAESVSIDRVAGLEIRDGGEEDILALLSREESPPGEAEPPRDSPVAGRDEREGEDDGGADGREAAEDAEPVDGLPIPSLWEELPCGLAVFDSMGNLVFSNALALELFGVETLAGLQDALENRRRAFNALGQNQKPLPDNQWPHVAAVMAKAPRSAIVSVERADKRRIWLRVDCLPHLTDGKVSRLSMTLVNMTGELPPPAAAPAGKKGRKRK